jgi:hypothetical protein
VILAQSMASQGTNQEDYLLLQDAKDHQYALKRAMNYRDKKYNRTDI